MSFAPTTAEDSATRGDLEFVHLAFDPRVGFDHEVLQAVPLHLVDEEPLREVHVRVARVSERPGFDGVLPDVEVLADLREAVGDQGVLVEVAVSLAVDDLRRVELVPRLDEAVEAFVEHLHAQRHHDAVLEAVPEVQQRVVEGGLPQELKVDVLRLVSSCLPSRRR